MHMRGEFFPRFEAHPSHRDAVILGKKLGEATILCKVFDVAQPMFDSVNDYCPHRGDIVTLYELNIAHFS
jgi:hypothetical protein